MQPLMQSTLSQLIYSVSQKISPPMFFWHFYQTVGNFYSKFYTPIIRCYLFIQLPVTLMKLCRRPTKLDHPVHTICSCPPSAEMHAGIFCKQFGNFSPNLDALLYVPIYARLQIFIQLSPTVTKLCYMKCDQPACVSAGCGQFKHMMLVTLNMA